MHNISGTNRPKMDSGFSRGNLINEKHNSMKQKINSLQYDKLKTITINSLHDGRMNTLPDDYNGRTSPSKQRIQTCNSSHSLQIRSPKLPKIFDYNVNANMCPAAVCFFRIKSNKVNKYKQRRFSSKNSVEFNKEKVPMSHFLFKSTANFGTASSKEDKKIQNIGKFIINYLRLSLLRYSL